MQWKGLNPAKVFITIWLILLSAGSLQAQNTKLTKGLYSIQFKNKTLIDGLNFLIEEKGIPLSFDPEIIPHKILSLNIKNSPLPSLLDSMLSGTSLGYIFFENGIIIRSKNSPGFELSGHIRDSESGEDLIGAELMNEDGQLLVISNNYGYYYVSLSEPDAYLTVRLLGYKTSRLRVHPNMEGKMEILLSREQEVLKTIQVKEKANTLGSGLSVLHGNPYPLEFFKKLPYYGGERDIIQALKMQNGIVGLSEGNGSLFIRGGNKDQNLFLLDEATVYNPGHLFGLVSIFNPDAVKNIRIYDDRIPANLGGRISSVIEAQTTDGDHQNTHVLGGISLLTSRISLEGPLFKTALLDGGNSYFLAFRYGLLNRLNNTLELLHLKASFYDINLKLNFRMNPKNQIFISGYNGIDNLLSDNSRQNYWGNQTATFRWNHLFNANLFFNLSGIYSNYQNILGLDNVDSLVKTQWLTSIRDFSFKGDFTYYFRTNTQFKFGFQHIIHQFIPGEILHVNSSLNIPRENATETDFYVQQIGPLFGPSQISYGLRASFFNNFKEDFNNQAVGMASNPASLIPYTKAFYFNLEPRVDLSYPISSHSKVHISFDRTIQYLHILDNQDLAFSSLETWIPSGANIKPQVGEMESIGYQFNHKKFLVQVELYDKQLARQLDLLDHTQPILNPNLLNSVRSGISNAYGLELTLQKISGKLLGTLAYTYSRAFRKITDINDGDYYPANYDIPNNLKFTLSYSLNPFWNISTFFIYSTGRPISLPAGFYYQENLRVPIFYGRNNSRFPDINRLDMNLSYEPTALHKKEAKWRSFWTFGIYNVYNKKTPLYFGVNQEATVNNLGYLRYFSGIAPNISYSFKF